MPLTAVRPLLGGARCSGRPAALVVGARSRPPPPTGGRSPPTPRIMVKGHGYGHGHGMSQYGAEGAARAGPDAIERSRSSTTPGPPGGRADGQDQRAADPADTTDDVVVLARSRPAGPRPRHRRVGRRSRPERRTRWRLVGVRGRRRSCPTAPAAGTAGGCSPGTASSTPQGEPVSARDAGGHAEPTAAGSGPRRPTPGASARDTVNVLTLENYLRGVVPLEMPALWSPDGGPRPVRRRPHLRRLRARRTRGPTTTRSATPPPARCTAATAPEEPASNAAIDATAQPGADGRRRSRRSRSSPRAAAAGPRPDRCPTSPPTRTPTTAGRATRSTPGRWPSPTTPSRRKFPSDRQPPAARGRRSRDGNGDWGGRVGHRDPGRQQGPASTVSGRHVPVHAGAALDLVHLPGSAAAG